MQASLLRYSEKVVPLVTYLVVNVAALLEVVFLQSICSFSIVDYNYYGTIAYRSVATAVFENCAVAMKYY